jgi:hypothetical protein
LGFVLGLWGVGERILAIWAKVWNMLSFLIVGSCVVDPSI